MGRYIVKEIWDKELEKFSSHGVKIVFSIFFIIEMIIWKDTQILEQ